MIHLKKVEDSKTYKVYKVLKSNRFHPFCYRSFNYRYDSKYSYLCVMVENKCKRLDRLFQIASEWDCDAVLTFIDVNYYPTSVIEIRQPIDRAEFISESVWMDYFIREIKR